VSEKVKVFINKEEWLSEGTSKKLSEDLGIPIEDLQKHFSTLGRLKVMEEDEQLILNVKELPWTNAKTFYIGENIGFGWKKIYTLYPDEEGIVFYRYT
jgi:hypothetical protein